MKNFITEFKQFAMKGNVVDLAVGVIIGGAFGKIVSSLVSDVVMPAFGFVLGNLDFKNIKFGPLGVGNFIQATVDFLIIAFVIFLTIKAINKFKKKEVEKNVDIPELSKEVVLLTEIRDLLKK